MDVVLNFLYVPFKEINEKGFVLEPVLKLVLEERWVLILKCLNGIGATPTLRWLHPQ